ncbi:alkylglycerol monooxygenase-like isoform X1 [Octopus sinensis]|uniref:Alkylglycerol monooxygenase n=1 Tax=Octopus sinensis TaxID=2607531 RepID=A0A6P7SAN9_9MOLL|nr:alkylglycerol monooxygenase-like isoform X1 [Octopus sinensis]
MESLQSAWFSPTGSKLRRMFYLVTPNETSFQYPEDVPEYEKEASPVFMTFVLVEAFVSLLFGHGKVRISDGLTSISAGILSRIPLIFLRSGFLNMYQWIYNNYHIVKLEWNSPYTWILTLLVVDFSYYWFHRLAHETSILWSAHQVHHSSEDYNFSTATRQSILQVYSGWAFYTPMALFVPISIYMVHEQLNLLYQFWIHTEYIRSLGPLEHILNTPSHHRVHHGRNPYCIDKNYGGSLIIWDKLFGTFQAEKEEVIFGLVSPINTFEPFTVQVCYWKHLWENWRQGRSLLNVLLRGPGWVPGQDPNECHIPEVEHPARKYTTEVSNLCSIYVLLHFTAVTYFFLTILSVNHLMPQESVLAVLVFIIYSLSCFGNIFDQRSYATYMEILRCGSALCISQLANFQLLSEFYNEMIVKMIPWFYGISALLWILSLVFGGSKQQLKHQKTA